MHRLFKDTRPMSEMLFLTSLVDDQAPKKSSKELMLAHRVGKKSRKRQRRLDRALQMIKVGSAHGVVAFVFEQ